MAFTCPISCVLTDYYTIALFWSGCCAAFSRVCPRGRGWRRLHSADTKNVHGCARCCVRCRACDAPGRCCEHGRVRSPIIHMGHMTMRTFYDARLHVLMMRDGNNIYRTYTNTYSEDRLTTSAVGSTALLLLMSSSSSSCRLLCRRYSSSRTSWRV